MGFICCAGRRWGFVRWESDGGPSTKINNRKKYYVMALGGGQTQQPTKSRVMTGGGRLPTGVSCSLGRPPLMRGEEGRGGEGREEERRGGRRSPAGWVCKDGRQTKVVWGLNPTVTQSPSHPTSHEGAPPPHCQLMSGGDIRAMAGGGGGECWLNSLNI